MIDIIRRGEIVEISDTAATPGSHRAVVPQVDLTTGLITIVAYKVSLPPRTIRPGDATYQDTLNGLIRIAQDALADPRHTPTLRQQLETLRDRLRTFASGVVGVSSTVTAQG